MYIGKCSDPLTLANDGVIAPFLISEYLMDIIKKGESVMWLKQACGIVLFFLAISIIMNSAKGVY